MSIFKEVERKIASSKQWDYWEEKGEFQKELNKIEEEHIPSSGRAKSLAAELVRAWNNLYYECFNNGWGNALLEEIEILSQNQSKFKTLYKGKVSLSTLLDTIEEIQAAYDREESEYFIPESEDEDGNYEEAYIDEEAIQKVSKERIEPNLDALGDAIIQYAYRELYDESRTASFSKNRRLNNIRSRRYSKN